MSYLPLEIRNENKLRECYLGNTIIETVGIAKLIASLLLGHFQPCPDFCVIRLLHQSGKCYLNRRYICFISNYLQEEPITFVFILVYSINNHHIFVWDTLRIVQWFVKIDLEIFWYDCTIGYNGTAENLTSYISSWLIVILVCLYIFYLDILNQGDLHV